MEETRFDNLSKRLASPISRRGILKATVASAVGGMLLRLDQGISAASPLLGACIGVGGSCSFGSGSIPCCTGLCTGNLCQCPEGQTPCNADVAVPGTTPRPCAICCPAPLTCFDGVCVCRDTLMPPCGVDAATTPICCKPSQTCASFSGSLTPICLCGADHVTCPDGSCCVNGGQTGPRCTRILGTASYTCLCPNGTRACLDGGCCGTGQICETPANGGHICVCATGGSTCGCRPNCGGKRCGPDGCGGTCGACPSGQICQSTGSCCTPITSCPAGQNCGTVPDGCGGVLTCGTCTAPQTCGGGGTPGVCGCTPATTCPSGQHCGTAPNGCGGTILCGTCSGTGQCCNGTVCVSSCSGSGCTECGSVSITTTGGTTTCVKPCGSCTQSQSGCYEDNDRTHSYCGSFSLAENCTVDADCKQGEFCAFIFGGGICKTAMC